jgi:poly(3-hydroxybutyrate) depolymerase
MVRLRFVAALSVALGWGMPAQAQDKVSFPSTDADLKGGTPTTVTGYLYKPEGPGPFPAVIGMHGCNGLLGQDGKVHPVYGTGRNTFEGRIPGSLARRFWLSRSW